MKRKDITAKWWEVLWCRLFKKKYIGVDKGCDKGDYTATTEFYKLGDKMIITKIRIDKE